MATTINAPLNLSALDELDEALVQILGASILDMDDELKRNSPVKDGYFVNSWQAQADGNPAPHEGRDGPRPGTSAEDAAVIFGGVAAGAVVSLVNTAVYAERLADGYSPQAPAGWVEAIANRLQDHVDRNALERGAANA